MSDTSRTVYLPFSTEVIIYGFTNAAYDQRITLTFEDGTNLVMTGTGEHNNPTNPAKTIKRIPASGANPNGYAVKVTIDHKSNNDPNWVSSKLGGGSCGVNLYYVLLVVSEDLVDMDWNDGVVQFCWWLPPETLNN